MTTWLLLLRSDIIVCYFYQWFLHCVLPLYALVITVFTGILRLILFTGMWLYKSDKINFISYLLILVEIREKEREILYIIISQNLSAG